MISQYRNLFKILCGLSIILFIVIYCIFETLWTSITSAISVSLFLGIFYDEWGWRLNPFEKTPKLNKEYKGVIEYIYQGKEGKKNVTVSIKQTLSHIAVKIYTDEIMSISIIAQIYKEYDENILYYIYTTEPKNKYSDKNPKQYALCRMNISQKDKIEGKYWTSRETKGDFYWYKK